MSAGEEASAGSATTGGRLGGNVAAILAMMLATAAFLCNDTIMKVVTERVPLVQAVFVRGMIGTALVLGLVWVSGHLGAWRRAFNPRILVRGLTEIAATFLFLTGLMHIPLPNATAIVNAVPLVMTVMAAIFLGERVGIRRWSAVVAGFAGILLIVRPGAEGFSAYALLVCGATLAIATRDVLTRGLDPRIPSLIVTLASMAMVACVAGLVTAVSGQWAAIATVDLGLVACAAVLVFLGFQFIVVSLRLGEVSAVAPFRYSVILWSLLMGYLVWGDVPGWYAIAGIVLITASGIYVFHREYRVGREAARSPR